MQCELPTSSPPASDAEDDGDDSSPDPDVIDALMGLSYKMTIDATVSVLLSDYIDPCAQGMARLIGDE